MSFIAKNPLIIPEIKHTPSTPPGTRGIFATKDGLYEVDSNNNVTLISENGGGSGNVDLSNYYTKEETTQLVDSKISTVYKYCGSVGTIDSLPNQILGENAGNTYNVITGTKSETSKTFDCLLTGHTTDFSLSEYNDLRITDSSNKNISHLFLPGTILTCNIDGINHSITLEEFNGDVWTVTFYGDVGWEGFTITQYESPIDCNDGDNVAWTGYAWDTLGNKIDLSNYYTKQENDIIEEQILMQLNDATKESENYFNKIITSEESYLSAGYYSAKATREYVLDELKNYYTKEETENKISTVFKYCGSVDSLDKLPRVRTNISVGDTYNVLNGGELTVFSFLVNWDFNIDEYDGKFYLKIFEKGIDITNKIPEDTITINNMMQDLNILTERGWELDIDFSPYFSKIESYSFQDGSKTIKCNDGDNLAWTGLIWDNLGGTVDLSNYAIKSDTEEALKTKQDISNMIQTIKEGREDKYPSEAATLNFVYGLIKDEIDDSMIFPSGDIPMASAVVNYVNDKFGNISNALDAILALQSQY